MDILFIFFFDYKILQNNFISNKIEDNIKLTLRDVWRHYNEQLTYAIYIFFIKNDILGKIGVLSIG